MISIDEEVTFSGRNIAQIIIACNIQHYFWSNTSTITSYFHSHLPHLLPSPDLLLLPLHPYPLVKDGLTALLMAAQNGHWEVVSTLLDGGADASIASEVCTYVHTYMHRFIDASTHIWIQLFTQIHTPLHAYMHAHPLYCTKPHCITLHCPLLHSTKLHSTVLNCTTLHYTPLHRTASHPWS